MLVTVRNMFGKWSKMLVFVGFLTALGLLSMADRAPGAVLGGLRWVRSRGQDIEAALGIDWIDLGDMPLAWDTAGHLVLWAGAGMLGYAAVGQRVGGARLAMALLILSGVVEVAQPLLSATRQLEVTDMVANGVGIFAGVITASLILKVAHNLGVKRLA